jgi:hypothetical protein
MSKLLYNPKVNGSVKVVEISPSLIDSNYKLLRRHYTNGDIILIDNFKFDIDYSLFDFQPHEASTNNSLKKPKMLEALEHLSNKEKTVARRTEAAMEACQNRIQELFKGMFPEVTSLDNITTWRFTRTNTEDYHLDIYADDFVTFRAFYNLSLTPRVWGFGHSSKDALDALRIKKEDLHLYEKGNTLSRLLNNKLRAWLDTQERHIAEFGHCSLWLCDSLKVGHQVVSGEKMAAFTYRTPAKDFGADPVVYRNYVNQALC